MSDRPSGHRSAADVLADWRDAERRIDGEPSGTQAWHRARLEAAALAEEYHAVIAELTSDAHDLAASPSVVPSAAAEQAQIRQPDTEPVARPAE
jgi:hypothetical protein